MPSASSSEPVPLAPTGVTAVAGYSSINVSWTASAPNGVAITGYRATASPGPSTCTTTSATSCVLGVEAGVSYTVSVVALSEAGPSADSAPSEAVVATLPVVSSTPPDTDLPLETGDGAISEAAPGQSLIMIGDGYAPYSSVTITVYSTPTVLGVAQADADGRFEHAVTVPAGLSGDHSFVASGVDENGQFRALRLDLTIAADSTTTNPSLPVTGAGVLWMVVTGLGLTLMGFALRSVRR